MPLYDYTCPNCNWHGERQAIIADRHGLTCENCGSILQLQISAVYGKVAGQVLKGGGGDRFTADALGIPLKELPAELKMDYREPAPRERRSRHE